MAVDEDLTERIRNLLDGIRRVEEKKMFRGIVFMVNGKMCVTASDRGMMCRIDPSIQKDLLKRKGCRVMTMKGRTYNGYVMVDQSALGTKKQLEFWIAHALEFNKSARASKKR